MPHGQLIHDSDNCHQPNEKPEDFKQIIINTNSHPNGEINIGYYAKGSWFGIGNSEIKEANIMCWHNED